jgi:PST family polysaccharide transporter
LAIVLSYSLSLVYLFIKKPSFQYKRDLNSKEKRIVWKNIIPLAMTLILTIIFSYIDISILGKFVEMSYVGYYSSAMMLVGAVASLLGFSIALFPLFSRLSGKKLQSALNRSLLVITPILLLGILITFIFSKYIILLVYGESFIQSLPVLKILAFLLLIDPLTAIYSSYHLILGNQKYLVKSMFFITIIDLILTLFIVNLCLGYSQSFAIMGAALSLVISKGLYFLLLVLKRK